MEAEQWSWVGLTSAFLAAALIPALLAQLACGYSQRRTQHAVVSDKVPLSRDLALAGRAAGLGLMHSLALHGAWLGLALHVLGRVGV